jgi:RimJ/RimL family protein N-acetyltransferase
MINWATEDEVNRFANFEFRILTRDDFPEFAQAYRESIESMSTYLDLGYFSQQRPYLEMLKYFQSMIKDQTVDLFGIFDKGRLLGVANYYWTSYSGNGTQITLWMRSSERSYGLGTYFMKRLTSHAIFDKKFRFVELIIDEKNTPSRRMAEKVGYELIEIMDVYTQGKLGSGKYCRYILFDGEIESIAINYHKQPMDLIDHPAYEREHRSLIHDEWINRYLAWPWEILNEKVYEGEPFGLELDRLMEEARQEDDFYLQKERAKLRPSSKLEYSRIDIGWAIRNKK